MKVNEWRWWLLLAFLAGFVVGIGAVMLLPSPVGVAAAMGLGAVMVLLAVSWR